MADAIQNVAHSPVSASASPAPSSTASEALASRSKYACEECDKVYARASDLLSHLRSHTGEKPFACDVCDKRFGKKSHLKRHAMLHTGEKPYKCGICDKRCARSSDLRVHLRTHSGARPYKCRICGRDFVTSSHVRMHERTHTTEHRFACGSCAKPYKTRSGLLIHQKKLGHDGITRLEMSDAHMGSTGTPVLQQAQPSGQQHHQQQQQQDGPLHTNDASFLHSAIAAASNSDSLQVGSAVDAVTLPNISSTAATTAGGHARPSPMSHTETRFGGGVPSGLVTPGPYPSTSNHVAASLASWGIPAASPAAALTSEFLRRSAEYRAAGGQTSDNDSSSLSGDMGYNAAPATVPRMSADGSPCVSFKMLVVMFPQIAEKLINAGLVPQHARQLLDANSRMSPNFDLPDPLLASLLAPSTSGADASGGVGCSGMSESAADTQSLFSRLTNNAMTYGNAFAGPSLSNYAPSLGETPLTDDLHRGFEALQNSDI